MTIRTTTLVRSCHVYIASVPHKTHPAKYSHFCWYFLIEKCHPEVAVEEQNWELEGERVTSLRMKLSRQSRNHQKAHDQRATQKKFQMNYKVMIQTPALKKLSIQKEKIQASRCFTSWRGARHGWMVRVKPNPLQQKTFFMRKINFGRIKLWKWVRQLML